MKRGESFLCTFYLLANQIAPSLTILAAAWLEKCEYTNIQTSMRDVYICKKMLLPFNCHFLPQDQTCGCRRNDSSRLGVRSAFPQLFEIVFQSLLFVTGPSALLLSKPPLSSWSMCSILHKNCIYYFNMPLCPRTKRVVAAETTPIALVPDIPKSVLLS